MREYKDISIEQIEKAINDFFNQREEKQLLPFTVKLKFNHTIFMAEICTKPMMVTGIGGFITLLSYVSIDDINLIVNDSLYIGENKKEFVEKLILQYANRSTDSSRLSESTGRQASKSNDNIS